MTQDARVSLEKPSMALLPGYLAALERGWTPEDDGDLERARQQLETVRRSPEIFTSSSLGSRRPLPARSRRATARRPSWCSSQRGRREPPSVTDAPGRRVGIRVAAQ